MTILAVVGDAHGEDVFNHMCSPKALLRTDRPFDYTFDLDECWSLEVSSRGAEPILVNDEIQLVYVRRPVSGSQYDGLPSHAREFVRREHAEAILGVVALSHFCCGARIVVPGRPLGLCHNKLAQVVAASECGLSVPRTCATNSPQRAATFYDRCLGNVVFKCLSSPVVEHGDGRRSMVYTSKVPSSQFAGVDIVPCLFQENISKVHELRVAVVGEHVLGVKIASQVSAAGQQDWRRVMREPGVYSLCDVPRDLAKQLVTLHRKLGLPWGMADLALTPSGQYVFFETNPDGAWLWLERAVPGFEVSALIASQLGTACLHGA